MVIPYVVAGAVLLLFARWAWMRAARRAYDRDLDNRIRNRRDLRNL